MIEIGDLYLPFSPEALKKLLRQFPFVAYVGEDPVGTSPRCMIVVRKTDGAIPRDVIGELVSVARSGNVIMVLSDSREVRTRVKGELIAAANCAEA